MVHAFALAGAALVLGVEAPQPGKPLDVQILTLGLETYRIGPGATLWSNRPYKVDTLPAECRDTLAVRGPLDKRGSTVTLRVTRPVRVYALLKWLWIPEAPAAGRLPKGWRLYAPAAFPLGREKLDLFYRDLQAGEHELPFGGAFAIVGVKPTTAMKPGEACVPYVAAAEGRYLLEPGAQRHRPACAHFLQRKAGRRPRPERADRAGTDGPGPAPCARRAALDPRRVQGRRAHVETPRACGRPEADAG
jgi:hypothetical protein